MWNVFGWHAAGADWIMNKMKQFDFSEQCEPEAKQGRTIGLLDL